MEPFLFNFLIYTFAFHERRYQIDTIFVTNIFGVLSLVQFPWTLLVFVFLLGNSYQSDLENSTSTRRTKRNIQFLVISFFFMRQIITHRFAIILIFYLKVTQSFVYFVCVCFIYVVLMFLCYLSHYVVLLLLLTSWLWTWHVNKENRIELLNTVLIKNIFLVLSTFIIILLKPLLPWFTLNEAL